MYSCISTCKVDISPVSSSCSWNGLVPLASNVQRCPNSCNRHGCKITWCNMTDFNSNWTRKRRITRIMKHRTLKMPNTWKEATDLRDPLQKLVLHIRLDTRRHLHIKCHLYLTLLAIYSLYKQIQEKECVRQSRTISLRTQDDVMDKPKLASLLLNISSITKTTWLYQNGSIFLFRNRKIMTIIRAVCSQSCSALRIISYRVKNFYLWDMWSLIL